MRGILIFAAVLMALGVVMAQTADRMSSARPVKVAALSAEAASPAGSRSVSIPRDGRGHFQAEGRIDGRRIGFMVDTGASVVALNESSAAKVGIRPARGDYNANVTTANGTIKGARMRLASLDVGGLEVRDVDAMILPDEALSENLLGLSYLARLRRFEYSSGRLLLEQ